MRIDILASFVDAIPRVLRSAHGYVYGVRTGVDMPVDMCVGRGGGLSISSARPLHLYPSAGTPFPN